MLFKNSVFSSSFSLSFPPPLDFSSVSRINPSVQPLCGALFSALTQHPKVHLLSTAEEPHRVWRLCLGSTGLAEPGQNQDCSLLPVTSSRRSICRVVLCRTNMAGQHTGALVPPLVSACLRRAQHSSVRERELLTTTSFLLSDFFSLGVRGKHQLGSRFLGQGISRSQRKLVFFLGEKKRSSGSDSCSGGFL